MGAIIDTRTAIEASLRAALPNTIDVIPYARNVDPPARPVVMVRLDVVRKSKSAGGLWDVEGALVLIAAKTAPGDGDDELDDLLSDVLIGLESDQVRAALNWTEATRGTYPLDNPTNPAYSVAVNTHTVKES